MLNTAAAVSAYGSNTVPTFGTSTNAGPVAEVPGSDVFINSSISPTAAADVFDVFVSFTRGDGSELVPAGTQNFGLSTTGLSFGVGGFAFSIADPISRTGVDPDMRVLAATGRVFFGDGTSIDVPLTAGTQPTAPNNFFISALSGQVDVADVNGADIREVGILWTVQVPTPGALAVFGLAGLAGVRRRRA